jgi:hypothetical protein
MLPRWPSGGKIVVAFLSLPGAPLSLPFATTAGTHVARPRHLFQEPAMKPGYMLAALLVLMPAGARGQTYTASHLQAAHELLGALQTAETVTASVTAALESQFRENRERPPFGKLMDDFLRDRVNQAVVADELAALYASRFNEQELRELAAFFGTPVGRKLARENADIMDEEWTIGERHGDVLGDDLWEVLLATATRGTVVAGTPATGVLTETDFRLESGSYFQVYTLEALAGDRVRITLRSTEFDALLGVIGDGLPESCAEGCSYDDDSGGGLDAMVRITIPEDGTYKVFVASARPDETGTFTLLAEILPSGRAPELRTVAIGESREGAITEADAELESGQYYHLYRFDASAGQRIEITLRSSDFDAGLFLGTMAEGRWRHVADDDDSGGDTDAQIVVELAETGPYFVRVTTFESMETGTYTLTIRQVSP